MKTILSIFLIAAATGLVTSTSAQNNCEPDGDIAFVCGPISPEDLVAIPQSPWIISSGMEDEGYLYLIDTRDSTTQILYPGGSSQENQDHSLYGDCSGPAPEAFRSHGLSLHTGNEGSHALYVTRHGPREAVEVFAVDTNGPTPALTWTGCVIAPESVSLNSVVALPEGGFAATNFQLSQGEIWEWQATDGWSKVPGSETSGPNGIEISADGRWYYIGGWGTQSLIRLSRGVDPAVKQSVEVGHHVDNVRWSPTGSLFAAGHVGTTANAIFNCLGQGQCEGVRTRVTEVDPEQLTAQQIIDYASNDKLILGTVAIQVGNEIWVGGIAGSNRIARFPTTLP